ALSSLDCRLRYGQARRGIHRLGLGGHNSPPGLAVTGTIAGRLCFRPTDSLAGVCDWGSSRYPGKSMPWFLATVPGFRLGRSRQAFNGDKSIRLPATAPTRLLVPIERDSGPLLSYQGASARLLLVPATCLPCGAGPCGPTTRTLSDTLRACLQAISE